MTTNNATFRKGDKVTLLSDWDRKGTVRIAELEVYSCGKQRMVLTAEGSTEKFEGHNFKPRAGVQNDLEQYPTAMAWGIEIYPRMTREDAIDAALAKGARIVAHEEREFLARIEGAQNGPYSTSASTPGYIKAMRDGIAALHQPSVVLYSTRGGEVTKLA